MLVCDKDKGTESKIIMPNWQMVARCLKIP